MGTKPLLKAGIVFVFSFLTMGLIPFLGLFAFNAQETELLKGILYYGIGAVSLFGILGLALINWLVETGKISEKKWGWANVYVFEPQMSLFAGTSIEKYITFRRVLHFSILVGLSLAYVGIVTQTSFVAFPNIEQQVTATGQLILSAEPASSSETLMMVVVISLLVGLSFWFVDRNDLPEATKNVFLFLIPIVGMGIWIAFHLARYGSSETNLGGTAFFGFFGTLETVLTGSPLSWYIWHVFLNIFGKAAKIFSSEIAQNIIIGTIVIYVLFLLIGFIIKQGKK